MTPVRRVKLIKATAAMQDPFNISLYPGTGTVDGRRGDHILLAPAYNVTEEEIRYIVDTTTLVIKQFFRQYAHRPQSTHMDLLNPSTCN